MTEASSRAGRIGPAGVGLIVLMAIGSVMMWLGAPIGIIYLAAHTLSKEGNPTMAPLVMIAVVLPVVIGVIAVALKRLDQAFSKVTGFDNRQHRIAAPWHRESTERITHRTTVLEIVMVISVAGAALLAGFLWLVTRPF